MRKNSDQRDANHFILPASTGMIADIIKTY